MIGGAVPSRCDDPANEQDLGNLLDLGSQEAVVGNVFEWMRVAAAIRCSTFRLKLVRVGLSDQLASLNPTRRNEAKVRLCVVRSTLWQACSRCLFRTFASSLQGG